MKNKTTYKHRIILLLFVIPLLIFIFPFGLIERILRGVNSIFIMVIKIIEGQTLCSFLIEESKKNIEKEKIRLSELEKANVYLKNF